MSISRWKMAVTFDITPSRRNFTAAQGNIHSSMPPKSKGKTKVSPNATFTQSSRLSSSEPPAPFSRAPSNLGPLLSKLSKRHVYITSIDNMPWQFKVKIFSVPLLMNVAILALIFYRIWLIGPYYFKIFSSFLGTPNETTLYPEQMTFGQTLYQVLRRSLTVMTDVMIYIVLWPWPRAFFGPNENENPVAWRFSIGFRDQEITIRRSRRWDELLGVVVIEGGEATEGGLMFLTNVRAATSRAFMHEKTGYSLLDKNWDLDWRMMILSTKMVDKNEMSIYDFKTTVLVHSEVYGWVIFDAQATIESKKEDEGRKKIIAFKDELTAIGKENLFFRWIELIQFESSQPGGFGPERQARAMVKAKELFESQGVDFEAFWAKIGGMEGMPGMDQM